MEDFVTLFKLLLVIWPPMGGGLNPCGKRADWKLREPTAPGQTEALRTTGPPQFPGAAKENALPSHPLHSC
jgi:hypothetical protein